MAIKQQMSEASKAVVEALSTHLATEPPMVVLAVLDAARFAIMHTLEEEGVLGRVLLEMADVDDEEDQELVWEKDEGGTLRARVATEDAIDAR